MKLVVLKNKIIEALSIVERAVGAGGNLPALKNILMRASENKISLNATNLEFAVTHIFSGKIVENGEVAIPAGIFSGLARGLTSERITLEHKGKSIRILTDNYEATIQSQDVKEFPIIPDITNPTHEISTTTKTFSEELSSVITAAQYSEVRPEISGVYIYHDQTTLLVATDSFRLTERKIQPQKTSKEGLKAIIPIKAAEETLRILSILGDEPLSISFDETQILFKTREIKIISRLIDGVFPDYKSIIPKNTKTLATVNRQEFLQAVKLVSSFSTKINDVKVSIGEGKKNIELSASNSGVGENIYRIPAKVEGEPFSISFNWRFLADGVKSFKNEEISIGVNENGKPAILRATGAPLLYVIMPLTI